jgi:hypothetical protein
MVKFKKFAIGLFLLFCFQSVVFAETLDKVVAVVNSEPVTQNELSQQMQIAKKS